MTQRSRDDDRSQHNSEQIAHPNFGRVHQALKTPIVTLIKSFVDPPRLPGVIFGMWRKSKPNRLG
jgi:hypothetical protein